MTLLIGGGTSERRMPSSHVCLDAKVDEIFTYKKSYVSVILVKLLDIPV